MTVLESERETERVTSAAGGAPLRIGPVSWLVPLRAGVVCVVGLAVLLALVAVDLAVGDFPIPVPDVVRTLLGGGDAGQRFVVMELRLPQTVVAVAVGAALGLAGALTQTVARNALASPDILGVTDGAALAAVAVIVLAGGSGYGGGLVTGSLQEMGLPLAAFVGAMSTATLLYVLSWRRGLDIQRLVLVGIGLSATLTAATAYLLVNARIQDAASAQVWLSGSLTSRGWEHARPVVLTLLVATPVALLLVRSLNAMLLGDDTARTLGLRLQLTQLAVLVVAVALTSVAVAAVGPAGVRGVRGAAGGPAAHGWLPATAARGHGPGRRPGGRRRPGHPGPAAVRTARRHRHRGDRGAVPDLAAGPHQPEEVRMNSPLDITASSRLGAEGVTVGYGGEPVVRDLTLDLPDGLVTTVVGPNGCGKSTLLRTLARLLKPSGGKVRLDGEAIDAVSTREVSRRMALLPQSPVAPDGLLVRDLVGRGRHPHQRWFRQWSPDDEQVVEAALRMTDTWDLRDRALDELSGGQRQRAWIAMTLAQDTDLVLLDEPTTFLDLAHQVEVLDLVTRLNRERGRTVVMVLHDLNLAARYSDLVVVMKQGAVVLQGPPREVFTEALLEDVFGLRADVLDDPRSGLPVVVPISAGV